ncbi:PHP domain-containing protein [Lentisphaerota bacterium WC36G]|nr:PHP domain-containing protein [Lentisphaerae bacterium WC36]
MNIATKLLDKKFLNDLHCHSTLSYCASAEMTLKNISQKLSSLPEINKLAITNHGFSVYFPIEVVFNWEFMTDNGYLFEVYRHHGNEKLARHLKKIDKLKDPRILKGIEVELMACDKLTVDEKFFDQLDVIIGSVHWLEVDRYTPSDEIIFESWWKNTQQLLSHNITILGHPLRYLYNRGIKPTISQIDALVKLAKEKNVAIELNSTGHNFDQDIPLLKTVLKYETILSIANDSHRLDNIGSFDYYENCCKILDVKLDDFNLLSF